MLSKLKPRPLTSEDIEKRRRFVSKFIPRRRTLEETEKKRRFWKKARRRLGWTLALLFVLHCALNIYSSLLLNRELSAIREKGEPLQFAELAPPEVPDAQNAALLYQQATKSLHFSPAQKRAFATRKDQVTPQTKRDIEAALLANQKALDLTRRAASMPNCRFSLNWKTDNPIALQFPYYAEMRELARLLSARAVLESKSGQSEAALRDVRAIFGMARHLSNEPVFIGFLVAQAVDAIGHQALARVLERVPLTLEQARAFETSLPATDWNRAFRHCFLGERASSIFAFQLMNPLGFATFATDPYLVEFEFPSQSWMYYPLTSLWRPVLKLDEVHSLRLWKLQLDAASNPQISAFSNFNRSLDKAVENTPKYAILTRILTPAFSRAADNRDRAEVRRRERQIALALAVYRSAKSQYPQKMKELDFGWKRALPLDPYSNKPFVYRREGNSFRLYSIGPNRRDDGGLKLWEQFPLRGAGFTDDIIWGGSNQ